MDQPIPQPVIIQLDRHRKKDSDVVCASREAFDPAILAFERLKSVKLPLRSVFAYVSLTLYLAASNLRQLTHSLVAQQVSAAVTSWNCVRQVSLSDLNRRIVVFASV